MNSVRTFSISTRITIVAFAAFALLASIVFFTLYSYMRTVLTGQIFREQYSLVSEIAEHLSGRIELARELLNVAVNDPGSSSVPDARKLQSALLYTSPSCVIFDAGQLIAGPKGQVIAVTGGAPFSVGSNLSSSDYVSTPLRSGEFFISKPFRFSGADTAPVIAMSLPVHDKNGSPVCAVVGFNSLNNNRFLTGLASDRLGSGSYLYLLHDRTIIMHPDSSRILETVGPGRNPGIDRAVRGVEGSMENWNSRGQHLLSSFKIIKGTGWILAVNTPYDKAVQQLDDLALNALLIAVFGTLLSLLVLRMIIMRQTSPIRQLTNHVDALTQQPSEWRPLQISTGDEIERLAAVFNGMMAEVQATRRQLNEEKEFFSEIIQHAAAPMFVIGRDHRILFWNNSLARLTGVKLDDVIGTGDHWKPFYSSQRPLLADKVLNAGIDLSSSCASAVPGETGAFASEGWFNDIGGRRRYLHFDAMPIRNFRREIVAAVETFEDMTELKLAQEAMTSHNLFLQEIIDAIPNPVFYRDIDGVYIGCNKSYLAFLGLESREVFGKSSADIMPLQFSAEAEKHDKEVLKEQSGFSYECEMIRHDGHMRTVLMTKAPFFTVTGEIGGIVTAFTDITDQARMAEHLRKMSRALEQSPATILITDTRGIIEYVNPKFCQTTGYTMAEAIGQNTRVLSSGEMPPEGYAELWRTITSGGEWRGEFHNRRKDGSLYWEYASISPLFDKEDYITGYLAVKEDITERKSFEAELSLSRVQLEQKHNELEQVFEQVELAKLEWEQTLDHLRDFVILADAEHRIRRCNKLLSDFTGRTIDELTGTDWRICINDSGFRFVTFNGTSGEIYHQYSHRSYDIIIYPIMENGSPAAHVVSINDTTELRRTTQELEKAYAELKEAQLQIFQQEKLASIGQLAAGVAHEINNPMGYISSNLGTLSKYISRISEYVGFCNQMTGTGPDCKALDAAALSEIRKRLKIDYILDDAGQLISESLDGSSRVRRIVQDLKSFSRIDHAEQAHISLNDAVETTINIAWNEIKYVADLERNFSDIPQILCYPQQLNQVILNLLINAAHAIIPGRRGRITVSTGIIGDSVFLSVADDGCGIPEELRQRIFEPFFTTKEVGKGTGLGLSISYDIIRKHGGTINVDSIAGRGTTFTVTLPVSHDEAAK